MSDDVVRVGAVAYHPKVRDIWAAFETWFAEQGLQVHVSFYDHYDTQVQALLDGDLDLAWNTNLAYVQADAQARRSGGEVVPLAMRNTDLGWTSHLVVPSASPVTSLEELRGARVGFGDADSPQAHVLPVHALRQQGFDPRTKMRASRLDRDLGKHGDTGGAELAQLARLRAGLLDACVVSSVTLAAVEGLSDGREPFRSVWTSPPFSHCSFCALAPTARRHEAFVELLLQMDATDPRLCEPMQLEYVQQWVRCDGSGYSDLVAAVEAGPVVVGGADGPLLEPDVA